MFVQDAQTLSYSFQQDHGIALLGSCATNKARIGRWTPAKGGGPPQFFLGIRIFLENLRKPGKTDLAFEKRTMVQKKWTRNQPLER